jgi:hypothetical protein
MAEKKREKIKSFDPKKKKNENKSFWLTRFKINTIKAQRK